MKKRYYVSCFTDNNELYASKTCKTKIGQKLFVRKISKQLKKENKCLKLVTLLK